jgi:hypothetical protein
MQFSTYRAEALRTSYTLYILHLECVIVKLQRLLSSGEISDATKARLQQALADTQAELHSLS